MTANLPEERLDASTTFTSVGVDYFTPFTVKIARRNEKQWCCLFTYLTVRAVHIEVVPKLDTDSCLNAIMRFIARRGKPSTIISDNGTNFVGAEREFAEYVAAWKFNSPAAPHFGGVWERFVKSCKKAMYVVLGIKSITEDVLSTTMCIVEQTLDATPMTPVSSDVNDVEALTPITSCLVTRMFAYHTSHAQKNLSLIESSFDKLKPLQTSFGTDFETSICQR